MQNFQVIHSRASISLLDAKAVGAAFPCFGGDQVDNGEQMLGSIPLVRFIDVLLEKSHQYHIDVKSYGWPVANETLLSSCTRHILLHKSRQVGLPRHRKHLIEA